MIGVGSAVISLFLVLVCYSLTLTAKRADENLLMICEQNQKIEEEKGKQEMESKRDILRVMEVRQLHLRVWGFPRNVIIW